MQGVKSWAWLPKFCKTFGVLCEGSSAGFLLCKPFHKPLLQNPKGSREFWGGGARTRLLRTGSFPPKGVRFLVLLGIFPIFGISPFVLLLAIPPVSAY